jgi:hypothetical protein
VCENRLYAVCCVAAIEYLSFATRVYTVRMRLRAGVWQRDIRVKYKLESHRNQGSFLQIDENTISRVNYRHFVYFGANWYA